MNRATKLAQAIKMAPASSCDNEDDENNNGDENGMKLVMKQSEKCCGGRNIGQKLSLRSLSRAWFIIV